MSVAGGMDDPARDLSQLGTHYDSVITGLMRGRVTPVLGAGVNLCGRAAGDWLGRHPPSGQELADYLAEQFKYPGDRTVDLLHVSQYIYAIRGGSGPLYDLLHEVFDRNFPTTPVHEFIATLPGLLGESAPVRKPPLVVTTNYDDLMEAAFASPWPAVRRDRLRGRGTTRGEVLRARRERPLRADPRPPEQRRPRSRSAARDPEDPWVRRSRALERRQRRQLRDHRGSLHRVPHADGPRQPDPGQGARATAELPLPVPGLQPERLEPARDPLQALERAVGGTGTGGRSRSSPAELERKSWRRRGVEIFDVPLDEYIGGLGQPVAGDARRSERDGRRSSARRSAVQGPGELHRSATPPCSSGATASARSSSRTSRRVASRCSAGRAGSARARSCARALRRGCVELAHENIDEIGTPEFVPGGLQQLARRSAHRAGRRDPRAPREQFSGAAGRPIAAGAARRGRRRGRRGPRLPIC